MIDYKKTPFICSWQRFAILRPKKKWLIMPKTLNTNFILMYQLCHLSVQNYCNIYLCQICMKWIRSCYWLMQFLKSCCIIHMFNASQNTMPLFIFLLQKPLSLWSQEFCTTMNSSSINNSESSHNSSYFQGKYVISQ